jgi:hypothetical protein
MIVIRRSGATAVARSSAGLAAVAWLTVGAVTPGCVSQPEPPAQTPAATVTESGGPAPAAAGPADEAPPERVPYRAYAEKSGNPYTDRFIAIWNDVHNPSNGYFSPEGVPYHAVETLLCEAPDYGHETTSEAYSYWLWMEASYGKITGDWGYLDRAWKNMERNIIPAQLDQPTIGSYAERHPATYAPEGDVPGDYPSKLDNSVPVGKDPLARELTETYGRGAPVYGMHWILDVDNWYGFGRRNDGVTRPSYMNTFQRGPQESVWETIPQPSWDDFKFGGKWGYVDLFVKSPGGSVKQWRYTDAPDADARAIQALFWAKTWADQAGGSPVVSDLAKRAAHMGDWLRYALFDKYFKTMGCTSPRCPGGSDYDSAHYLLSWYYAWGGSIAKSGSWSFRIGASSAHGGYQNPLAAYALSSVADFKPLSPNAARDWKLSLERQLEFYRWLQSAEGAIAGGATNSWNGRYEAPPAGTPTFYGLAYDEAPVYHDPPSNEWFGFQAWSMDRVAEYYYVTGDAQAKIVLDRWVGWVKKNTKLTGGGGYQIPSTLGWSGKPSASWSAESHAAGKASNAGLHVQIRDFGDDAGVAAATARTLAFYAAKSGDKEAQHLAKQLLDRMWSRFRDKLGVSTPETRTDFKRFADPVAVPASFKGKMPDGDPIEPGATFLSLRSKYKNDPDWPKVQAYLNGGKPPVFSYHRMWAQSDIAIANASYGWLFPDDKTVSAAGAAGGQAPAHAGSGRAHSSRAEKKQPKKKQSQN